MSAAWKRSKQALGTRRQFTQRSSNRLWLCYFCSLTLRAMKNDILFLIIWCVFFTRYTALSAEFVFNLSKLSLFHNLNSSCLFFIGRLCVVYVWLGQTSVNENTTYLERVLYLCLTLDWRLSDVFSTTTFTRGKRWHFCAGRKCAQRLTHTNKWMTFIRRSRQIINKFWWTPSDSQRTDKNSPFFCALEMRDGMCDWAFRPVRVMDEWVMYVSCLMGGVFLQHFVPSG